MDIEPPIKPANDSDDNKSNDSTASQPQHLQEMAKSTTVLKDVSAPPVMANDNASAEAPVLINVAPSTVPVQPEILPLQVEPKPVEAPIASPGPPQHPAVMLAAPPAAAQIPPTASVHGPIPHSQESPIVPPNVTVPHHQGMGIAAPHLPPHGAYPGYPQGPPRAPFSPYGHMPGYQQGFQQYPYGHHMPPYQQNYHGPPHGYPVAGPPVPGHPATAENHNPYQQGPPAMHGPIPHQAPSMPPTSAVAPPAGTSQPEETAAAPQPAVAAPEKNGS